MNKLAFMRLWDIYGGLLTPTQREITDLYFNKDLTLSEIAEEKNVSRQAVSECLKTCRNQLEEYEGKLGFLKLLDDADLQTSLKRADAGRWATGFLRANPQFGREIAELEKILEKDYSAEVAETSDFIK